MYFDIVSDLHVDKWRDFEYNWELNKVSDIVIIAGDISDIITETIIELKKACGIYKTVLYVEGNHEATYNYDNIEYSKTEISEYMTGYNNFVFLSEKDYIIDNLVIIGATAWWDFKICEPDIAEKDSIESFDINWCPTKNLSKKDIVKNIKNAAYNDYNSIKSKILKYKNEYNICIVTHTVPHKSLLSKNYPYETKHAGQYGNSLFAEFFNEKSVRCFIFGHNHDKSDISILNDKLCVNNARGRPSDYNRIEYKPIVIELY